MVTPPLRARLRPLLAPAGLLAPGAILGAVATLGLVLLPTLEAGGPLVDANLGTALARDLALPVLAGVWLVAGAHAAWVWLQSGDPLRRTVAALLLAAATVERLWLAPTLFATWSRVDRVTSQPADRVAEARDLALQHGGMLLALVLLAILAVVLAGRARPAEDAALD